MKYIKLALVSLVLLFLLVMAITAFIPSTVRISRSAHIEAPLRSVHESVSDLRTWPSWNLFVADSVTSTPSISAEKITDGGLNIMRGAVSDSTIETSWQRSGKSIRGDFVLLDGENETTIIQWYFDIKLKWYPWEKISSIVFDKQLGPLMDKSLSNLKKISESPEQ